jgi:hypothetical protein
MKLKYAYILGLLAMASNANAALYAVSNVVSGYGYSDGLYQNTNNTLLDGGIVAFGVFGGSGFNALDIPTSIANFTTLASALAGSNSATLGGSFAGYVETEFDTANVTAPDALIGQTLYVFVGNASTLATSTAFGLFSAGTIQDDVPNEQTYLANPFSSLSPNTLLLGEVGSFTGLIATVLNENSLTDTYSTLKLTAPIPEPSAAILGGLGALAACVRRRRN